MPYTSRTSPSGLPWNATVLLKANYGEDSEYIQSMEPGNTAAYSSEKLFEQHTVYQQYLAQ